jgi:hypothetical protein
MLEKILYDRNISAEELTRVSIIAREQQNSLSDRERLIQRLFAVLGKYDSRLSDVSKRHDDYLAEARRF